ncbi:MAG: anthranilate synthase component I family protein [Planctomycetota bacterium]
MLVGPRRQLDWSSDPLEVAARWPAERGLAVLHSGRADPRWSRWSVLAEPKEGWEYDGQAGIRAGFAEFEGRVAADDAPWFGVIGYDAAYGLERIGCSAERDHAWPAAAMRRCPGWLLHDRVSGRWWAGGTWAAGTGWADDLLSRQPSPPAENFGVGDFRSDFTEAAYRRCVERCLAYIAAGDVFQVNLTQRYSARFVGDPRAAFHALSQTSPAWYGAYLEWPATDARPALSLASISPELLLEMHDNGALVTRPIKGTRPAGTPEHELDASEKDAAELAMIVDLLRNDLGRVCAYGSVRVEEARTIEHHPTVQHGVATIRGRLHDSCGLADVLRAVLPGGSITGAPKVRAMQIIDELEPVRRGPYCGAVGWVQRGTSPGARMRGAWNVAIRTALVERPRGGGPGRVSFGVGGGIVADSQPAAEYAETLVKAAALRTGLSCGRREVFGGEFDSRPAPAPHLLEFLRETTG